MEGPLEAVCSWEGQEVKEEGDEELWEGGLLDLDAGNDKIPNTQF